MKQYCDDLTALPHSQDREFETEGGNAPHVDPQRYIGPGGAIEMQVKHTVFVPFLAFTFESFID